jgi:hypothetical protein
MVTVTEKFLSANRAKAAAASEAAKKKAMEKKVDKPTSTYYGGVKGVKFKDDAQRKEYVDILKEKYKFPTKSVPSKFSNQNIAKKFKITPYEVERINSALKKELNLEYPKQTYEGEQKRQRERDVRRKADIKKTSSPKIEKEIKNIIKQINPTALKNNIDLAHRASLRANSMFGADYLASSLGVDPKSVNQELVRSAEQKLGKLYDDQRKLIKGLTPGKFPKEIQRQIENINYKISRISGETKGALQGVLMDEKTGKVGSIVGKDYAKVLGAGLIDKNVKNLTKADLDIIRLNLPEQIKRAQAFKGTKLYSGLPIEGMYELGKEVITKDLPAIAKNVGKLGKPLVTTGAKLLPPAFAYIAAADIGSKLQEGYTFPEALEYGLVGTDMIGGFKKQSMLTPKEREARQVLSVPQTESLDELGGMGYIQGPSTLSVQEAEGIMGPGLKRVQQQLEEQRAKRRAEVAKRAEGLGSLEDIYGYGP